MTGIGGVKMWIEDFLINSSSYSEDYRKNFIKINKLWLECTKAFKQCKSIKACNDAYEIYENKVEALREEIYNDYGKNKMPLGLSDTLDYFEEAVGDLEDRRLDKLTNEGGNFTVYIPFSKEVDADVAIEFYTEEYKDLKFEEVKGKNVLKVTGEFYDVQSFLDTLYQYNSPKYNEIIDKGEFENA